MKILLLPLFPHHPGRNIFVQSKHVYIPKTNYNNRIIKKQIIFISLFSVFISKSVLRINWLHYVKDIDLNFSQVLTVLNPV